MKLGFSMVYCKKSDSNGLFTEGTYYPVCGTNNGKHVVGTNKEGDAVICLLYNAGEKDEDLVDANPEIGNFVHTDAEFFDLDTMEYFAAADKEN